MASNASCNAYENENHIKTRVRTLVNMYVPGLERHRMCRTSSDFAVGTFKCECVCLCMCKCMCMTYKFAIDLFIYIWIHQDKKLQCFFLLSFFAPRHTTIRRNSIFVILVLLVAFFLSLWWKLSIVCSTFNNGFVHEIPQCVYFVHFLSVFRRV